MTQAQWLAVSEFRQEFRDLCKAWEAYAPQLRPLQKEAAAADTPPYPLETPVVYNRDYDRLCPEDELTLIVIGDNPGKEEQLDRNRRYLVGQSGRVAEGFFRRNPELRTDFRKNVLIMNKTPVHTAKTAHLRYLIRNGGADIQALIAESQRRMAQLAAVLHQRLVESRAPGSPAVQLWLVGYAELKGKGLFLGYRDALLDAYRRDASGSEQGFCPAWDAVCVFQHFSMNRFLIDLKGFRETHPELSLEQSLAALGHHHRSEIFASA
jgi:hypothetical protein